MQKTNTAEHLGYLDGLRGLAAVFIVLCHASVQIDFSQQPLTGFAKRLFKIFEYGHYAVGLFIVLSGFCLMLPIVKGNGEIRGGTLNFFKRRGHRILPPYYFAMAFSLLLIWLLINQKTGTHWDISIPVTAKSIFTHLILMHDAFGDDFTINHAFWSIAVEWRIYFLFPLLVLSWRRIGPVATTVLAIFCSYIVYRLCKKFIGSDLSAHYIGLFAAGMLGAAIVFSSDKRLSRLRQLPWGWITAFMSTTVIILSVAKIWNGDIMPIHITDYFVGLWSMSLLIMVSLNQTNWVAKFLSYRPIVILGTFAYSIYLIHAPLLQVFWQYIFYPLQEKPLLMFAALSILGTPAIVGLSYIFFLVCERPFLKKGKRNNQQSLVVEAAIQPAP